MLIHRRGVRPAVRCSRHRLALAAACVALCVASACSGGGNAKNTSTGDSTASGTAAPAAVSPAPATVSPAPSAAAQITIEGFGFGDQLTVAPGAHVTVLNKGSAEHSVTSDTAGLFDIEVDGNEQAVFNAPPAPGSYPFHCRYHPSMHSLLVVR